MIQRITHREEKIYEGDQIFKAALLAKVPAIVTEPLSMHTHREGVDWGSGGRGTTRHAAGATARDVGAGAGGCKGRVLQWLGQQTTGLGNVPVAAIESSSLRCQG